MIKFLGDFPPAHHRYFILVNGIVDSITIDSGDRSRPRNYVNHIKSGHDLCLTDSLLAAKTPVSTAKVSTTESSDKEVEKTTSKPSEWPR